MPQALRVFVSSPGDVASERLRADLVIDKLTQEYSRFFTIECYRWEHEAMLASGHFQDAIDPPSKFDIVVLILWSRLGSPLPPHTALREYRGSDGRVPVTGTEWEYEDALTAAKARGAPDLLAFRNMSAAPVDTRDPAVRARSIAQLDALDAFWRRHFVDGGVFLAAFNEYETLEQFAQKFEQALRHLIERRIRDRSARPAAEPDVWPHSPYRGLESYEFEHAPIFFGRDALVAKATEQIAGNARAGAAFLLVSGASGSGKSSLVKAGVLPRLMKPQRISGLAFLRRVTFRPGGLGHDLFFALAEALIRTEDGGGLPELVAEGQGAAELAGHLRGIGEQVGYLFTNALGRVTAVERRSHRLLDFEQARLVLLVDQLEEVFTDPRINDATRQQFIRLVAALARSGAVWVIATLRSDFWHLAAEIPELVALAEGHGRIDVAAPTPAELAAMVREPARAADLTFETSPRTGIGLDDVLAEEAATEPGALPLLSFALDELYRSRERDLLGYASYAALGGLAGAIAHRAEEILASLPADAQAALPRVLRALTTISAGTGGAPVARAAQLQRLTETYGAEVLVRALIDARLLNAGSDAGGEPTVRLAHEALLRSWQRARALIDIDRRDLATRAILEDQLHRWADAPSRKRDFLLGAVDLANARDLAKRWGDELSPELHRYIGASGRAARQSRLVAGLAIVAVCCLAIAAVVAQQQTIAANKQTIESLQAGQRAAYQVGVDIVRKLAASDPDNAQWQLELVDRLDQLSGSSDPATARRSLEEAMKILQSLRRVGKLDEETAQQRIAGLSAKLAKLSASR